MSILLSQFACVNDDKTTKLHEMINQYENIKTYNGKINTIYDFKKGVYLINYKNLSQFFNNVMFTCKSELSEIPISSLNICYDKETIEEIKQRLQITTTKNHYNGWNNRTLYGYHSFNIGNLQLNGQRNPIQRINIMKKYINFNNKTIIDFGCNTGGMILHLPELDNAIGMDFDENCIQNCQFISSLLKYNTQYDFRVQDLNQFSLTSFLSEKGSIKIDIIFLLSLGSWISNWKELYTACVSNSDIIVLETNNDREGEPQLELFKYLNCDITMISDASYDDITNNTGRKTYIIKKIT